MCKKENTHAPFPLVFSPNNMKHNAPNKPLMTVMNVYDPNVTCLKLSRSVGCQEGQNS